jgi:excisionase family DNA binding protein
MADEVMTMPEAAAYLKIHLATLKRWIREGVIPVAKISRRVLVRKQAVDEALRQHEQRRRLPIPAKSPETRCASSRPERAS